MSGIRISAQHFALGDPNELAVHVPRAMRRHEGINQFSSVELVDELLRRPNGNSSFMALISKVVGRLSEIETTSASLSEQIAELKTEDNPLMTEVIKELSSVRSELTKIRESEDNLKSELGHEVEVIRIHTANLIDQLNSRFSAELSDARTLTNKAEAELLEVRSKPYKAFTTRQLLAAFWRRVTKQ